MHSPLKSLKLRNYFPGLPALVAEEKVVFGLNAKAVTHLTLAKIRKVYSRVDNKSIAKQV